jgi:Tol biopolymer transport system component
MDFNPKISLDSKLITYSSSITENTGIRTNDYNQFSSSIAQVFITDIKGYNRKQLTFTGSNFDPSFSPDGNKIVFISNRTGSAELWIMNKDGSGQRKLTNTGATKSNNPIWSKDGQKILFNTNYKQNYKSFENTNAWIYDLSTYQMRMLSNDMNNPDW